MARIMPLLGLRKTASLGTIRREMQERFQKEPSGLDDKGAVILAYAYLRANVPFTLPFFDNDEEFLFTDGAWTEDRGILIRTSAQR